MPIVDTTTVVLQTEVGPILQSGLIRQIQLIDGFPNANPGHTLLVQYRSPAHDNKVVRNEAYPLPGTEFRLNDNAQLTFLTLARAIHTGKAQDEHVWRVYDPRTIQRTLSFSDLDDEFVIKEEFYADAVLLRNNVHVVKKHVSDPIGIVANKFT